MNLFSKNRNKISLHFTGAILSVLAFLLYTIADASRKLLINDYDIISIIFWSSLLTVIIITITSLLTKNGLNNILVSHNMKMKILRGIILSFNTFFGLAAFSLLPMTNAYIIILTAPLIVVLLSSRMYGEKITRYKLLAIAIGFIGAFIVIRPGFTEFNIGYLAAFGCAVFFAIGSSLIKKIGNNEGTLSHSFYPQIMSVFLTAIYLMFDITPISLDDLPLVILASASIILGTSFIAWSMNKIQSSETMLYHYSQIIWGIIIGYIVFSDIPDIYSLIGASFVFSSGVVIYMNSRKK